jgi:hypothetical protein
VLERKKEKLTFIYLETIGIEMPASSRGSSSLDSQSFVSASKKIVASLTVAISASFLVAYRG